MTRILLLAVIALTSVASCRAPAETDVPAVASLDNAFDRGSLLIESDDGVQHEIDVYLATESDQHRRGLMFVREMPDNVGMLFVYKSSDMHSMWMKNTYIPLDIIFARADGSVSSVIHDTQPLSLTSQGSIEPVKYVLELNAGTARRLNIGRKSRIILRTGDGLIGRPV